MVNRKEKQPGWPDLFDSYRRQVYQSRMQTTPTKSTDVSSYIARDGRKVTIYKLCGYTVAQVEGVSEVSIYGPEGDLLCGAKSPDLALAVIARW